MRIGCFESCTRKLCVVTRKNKKGSSYHSPRTESRSNAARSSSILLAGINKSTLRAGTTSTTMGEDGMAHSLRSRSFTINVRVRASTCSVEEFSERAGTCYRRDLEWCRSDACPRVKLEWLGRSRHARKARFKLCPLVLVCVWPEEVERRVCSSVRR